MAELFLVARGDQYRAKAPTRYQSNPRVIAQKGSVGPRHYRARIAANCVTHPPRDVTGLHDHAEDGSLARAVKVYASAKY